MDFRTPVKIEAGPVRLSHEKPVTFLGSCFSDNMASRMIRDGFRVCSNPGGALYNPASIASFIIRAISCRDFKEEELVEGPRGLHLLDLATPFSGNDASEVISKANDALRRFRDNLVAGGVCFITLGTARVFEWRENGKIAGNCHKIPGTKFTERRMSVAECKAALWPAINALTQMNVHTVLTVSPIRHLADGLHGNTLSKATLHLASEQILSEFPYSTSYFPAYEALIDDLRDYRFTAADMKHPTDQAADYIYGLFSEAYYSPETLKHAAEYRKEAARTAHRPILQPL